MGGERTVARHRPDLYVENDRPAKSAALLACLRRLGYVMHEHRAPLFNPENYFGVKGDVFAAPAAAGAASVVAINLFCHRRDVPCPLDPAAFGMRPVA